MPGGERVAAVEEARAGCVVECFALHGAAAERDAQAVGAAPLPRGIAAFVDFARERGLQLRVAAEFVEAEVPDAAPVLGEEEVPVSAGRLQDRDSRIAFAGNVSLRP